MSRRGREMGVVDDSELEVTEDVFKYVDEKEYAMIVQQRQEEGFVLDDGEWACPRVGVVTLYLMSGCLCLVWYRWVVQ